MMPENFEKNMYLRRHQGKINLLRCPKNTDKLWFLSKSHYHDVRKYCKNIEKKNMYLRRILVIGFHGTL